MLTSLSKIFQCQSFVWLSYFHFTLEVKFGCKIIFFCIETTTSGATAVLHLASETPGECARGGVECWRMHLAPETAGECARGGVECLRMHLAPETAGECERGGVECWRMHLAPETAGECARGGV